MVDTYFISHSQQIDVGDRTNFHVFQNTFHKGSYWHRDVSLRDWEEYKDKRPDEIESGWGWRWRQIVNPEVTSMEEAMRFARSMWMHPVFDFNMSEEIDPNKIRQEIIKMTLKM